MTLHLSERETSDGVTVVVDGLVDISTAAELEALLLAVVRRTARDVTVDLGDVTFLDSTGLGVLVTSHIEATTRSTRLFLTRPSRGVLDLLAITGLNRVMRVR